MRRSLLSLVLAAVLGVVIMLVPPLLLHTDMRVMEDSERATYASEGGKIITTPKPILKIFETILPEVALIVIFGVIPAAATFILIKRGLKI